MTQKLITTQARAKAKTMTATRLFPHCHMWVKGEFSLEGGGGTGKGNVDINVEGGGAEDVL